ncbi:MAG: hypothetical protein WC642_02550 [Nocardioides sp.]
MVRLLLLTVSAVLLSGCGGPAETEARDPAPSPSASSSAPVPSGAPVEFRLVLASSFEPAPDSQVLQQFKGLDCDAPPSPAPPEEPLVACDDEGVKYVLEPASIVGGIESASAEIPEGQLGWVVNIELDAGATDRFSDIAAELLDTGGQFAVVLEGRILTAPTVNAPITNGELEISGNFSEESAEALADRLAE